MEYEYKILASERRFYPDTPLFFRRGKTPGWSDWSDYEQFPRNVTRPANQPYRTLAGVKGVISRNKRDEYGSGVILERRFKTLRRPVVDDWEEFDL